MADQNLPSEPEIVEIEAHDLTVRSNLEFNCAELEIVNPDGLGFLITLDAGVIIDVATALIRAHRHLSGYAPDGRPQTTIERALGRDGEGEK